MTNAHRFEQLFGFKATELWALPENQFLKWLTSEATELRKEVKPMTNADRIRSMSDGELADYLHSLFMDCPPNDRCPLCECVTCWLKWLKQEVERSEEWETQ